MTSQSTLLISVLLGDAVVTAGTSWFLRKATSTSDLQGGESPYFKQQLDGSEAGFQGLLLPPPGRTYPVSSL